MNNDEQNTNMQHNEFERFIREFHLREPKPLPELAPSPRIRRRLWWTAWTAAAVAVSALVVVMLLPAKRNPLISKREVLAVMQSNGERIEGGKLVRSTDDSSAMLALADSSNIEMKAQSELSFERAADGILVRLSGGSIIVSAAGQGVGHLYVETKDLRVSVVGTIFMVSAEKAGSRVVVIQGEVRVDQRGLLKSLMPGEQMATSTTMQPVSLIEQIAWSRNAGSHLALLERATVTPPALPVPAAISPPIAASTPKASQPPGPAFEVATIKLETQPGRMFLLCQGIDMAWGPNAADFSVPRGRCQGRNVTLKELIAGAYNIPELNVSGGPGWASSKDTGFRLDAKAEDTSSTTTQQLRKMLQTLLAERFRLVVHFETTERQGYVLLVGKGRVLLNQASGNQHGIRRSTPQPGRSVYDIYDLPMSFLADFLDDLLHLPVVDKTGLAGTYDYRLTLDRIGRKKGPPVDVLPGEEYDPPIPLAVEDQLGLRMERQRVPVQKLVIDQADKLSEN